jgi:hypothetical protein
MSIVYRNAALNGQPGVHAFIAGVSAYRHLPDYQPPPGQPRPPVAADSFGMRQLSAASLSAMALANWLLANLTALARPLASLRVLLSPQYGQPTMNDVDGNPVDRCSRADFVQAAIDWRDDLQHHQDGIALFYFAGHGVQRTPRDSVLLTDDFNDPAAGATLNNAIDTGNLYNGLTVHASRPNIARSQFLFIDACRVMPLQLAQYQALAVPAIWNVELSAVDQRSAPIFFAAQSGTSANALPNRSTLFGEALISSLENDALHLDDSTALAQWTINSTSLKMALDRGLNDLNRTYRGDQIVVVDGNSGDPVLRTSTSPPRVRQSISLDPAAACSVTQVALETPSGVASPCPMPFPLPSYEMTVDGGFYVLSAKVQPPATFVSSRRTVLIEPSKPTLRVSV